MAKGRKSGLISRERLLESFSYNEGRQTTSTDSSEFGEADVWSILADMTYNESHTKWTPYDTKPNGNRRIENTEWNNIDDRHVGGLQLVVNDVASPARIVHQLASRGGRNDREISGSAPVNVPDWSKILRVNSVESIHESDDDSTECCSARIPPHEYLARDKRNYKSVFEGVGRTLKGRDMSRVRDAVWNQTGFDG
ncbi:hypothetical protein GIB67_027016 [Kingdonia uniflora]|uniref:Uncharacterized protein n=1 Tax=Kingdonia uniflora TaxID=39325 RepID=A0A7J7P1L5_9MAGN|nr:hypothetical protein GIB67_027016 [Kingdonia uniflora]